MNLINQISVLSAYSLQSNLPEIESIANKSKELIPEKLIHSVDFLDLEGTGLPENAHQLCPRSRSPENASGPKPVAAGDLQARIERQADGSKQASALPEETVPLQPVEENLSADAANESAENPNAATAEADAATQDNTGQSGTAEPSGGSAATSDAPAEGNPAATGGDGDGAAAANDGAPTQEAPAGANPGAAPGAGNTGPAQNPTGQANPTANAEGGVAPANETPTQAPGFADATNPPAAPAPFGTGDFGNGLNPAAPPQGASPVFPGIATPPTIDPAAAMPPIAGPGAPAIPAMGIPTGGNLPAPEQGPTALGGVGTIPMTNVIAAGQNAPLPGGNAAIEGIVGEKIASDGRLAGAFAKLTALPAAIQNAVKALLLSLLARVPADAFADPVKSRDAIDKILQAIAGVVQKILGGGEPKTPVQALPNAGNLARDNAGPPLLGQNAQDTNWQRKLNPEAKDIQWAAPFGQHEWKDDVLHIKGGKYRGCRGYYDKKACKLRVFTKSGQHVANQKVKHEKQGRPRVSSPLAEAHAS